MNLYLVNDETWVHTQDLAKATGLPFEKINFPTDLQGLLAELNRIYSERRLVGELAPELPDREPEEAPLPSPIQAVAEPSSLGREATEQAISNATGSEFAWMLIAILTRLGELRSEGWDNLRAIDKLYRSNGNFERGLGHLILSSQ